MFITALTKTRHLNIFCARLTQSMSPSHFSKMHFNIILPSTRGFFKWSPSLRLSYHNSVCTSILPIRATCPSDFSLDHPNDIWWGVQSSLLCSTLHSPVNWSLVSPKFVLSSLFWTTLSLRSCYSILLKLSVLESDHSTFCHLWSSSSWELTHRCPSLSRSHVTRDNFWTAWTSAACYLEKADSVEPFAHAQCDSSVQIGRRRGLFFKQVVGWIFCPLTNNFLYFISPLKGGFSDCC